MSLYMNKRQHERGRECLSDAISAFVWKKLNRSDRSTLTSLDSNFTGSKRSWEILIDICRQSQLRKRFVTTLSMTQVNSLRLLFLSKSNIVGRPCVSPAPGLVLERLSHSEMGLIEADAHKLRSARHYSAEAVAYIRLLDDCLKAAGLDAFCHNGAVLKEYLNLERYVRSDSDTGPLGITLEPGDWLSVEARRGMPLYLWDAVDGKTVKTESLDRPRYVVVSHTWGRWKLKSREADMRPQVPWLVPENTLFPVRDLPSGLKKLSSRLLVRYVWLDLLCIPQDRSPEAESELSRQAAIFGGAVTAVVWLNTTSSWDLLQDTVMWLALDTMQEKLKYMLEGLRFPLSGIHERQHRMKYQLPKAAFQEKVEGLRAALKSKENSRRGIPIDDPGYVPLNWFTSLWTLQEVYLRPDMILANKDWDIFTIYGKNPVSLETLRYINVDSNARYTPSMPGSVLWLYGLLITVPNFDVKRCPLGILNEGGIRQCTKNRSEAIMSAVGCVKWHRKAAMSGQSRRNEEETEPLVLGQYVYEFLDEVLEKYGFIFFGFRYTAHCQLVGVLESGKPMGTILPFETADRFVSTPGKEIWHPDLDSIPHPSVASWKLLRDGSVKIDQVGIWCQTPLGGAYTGIKDSYNPDCYKTEIVAAVPDWRTRPPTEKYRVKRAKKYLHEWMMETWTDASKYAVILSASPQRARGFIFLEVGVDTKTSAIILAKLGDFFLDHSKTEIKTTKVNWIIY
ncbi:hypothetical protein MGYG_00324 [Nannizzia gypsea CBS 118893]|uniref:Heterokaryon incompatibility domain-containing protein n=1 Tax=Arthroderma gypseum (strain ATCC MYA-4604 / CBS 118893) TaxID=535722 RepID=E5QYU5_ARTGP|nr:hypothetical protein MGYG_00324 [Nannizzia gypsea CBS 118893]EFQ97283.1 hypothetical protein MGYG_00324 [Nannizzia gypsea CBS 118893]